MDAKKIERIYSVKHYRTGENKDISDVLLSSERNIAVRVRDPNNEVSAKVYSNFDDLFGTYLSKLPNNNVKKYVSEIFNKKLIFIGFSASRTGAVFVRALVTDDDSKLAGVVLENEKLGIDMYTGETNNIDDCIYACYYGLLRAAVITNASSISGDYDLHRLLTTYLYQIFLKSIGQRTVYSDKAKNLLRLACIYAYYRHFYKKNHQRAISIIKREYSNSFDKEQLKEFLPLLNGISKYNSIKEIPKMLIDLNVVHESPNAVLLSFLRTVGNEAFYNIIGSLDHLIATVACLKYPTDLLGNQAGVSSRLHDNVDNIMEKYLKKLKYEISRVLVKSE